MITKGKSRGLLRGGAVLYLAMLAACAIPATHPARLAEPTPCRDSTYVQLRLQHPDSLSERAWQRLQTLGRECEDARAQERHETSGMMGMGHGTHSIGMGVVTIMMLAMMLRMW